MDAAINNSTTVANERKEPLSPNAVPPPHPAVGQTSQRASGLNDTLNTSYIDVPSDDVSWYGSAVRFITGLVGKLCSPRQMLVVLRILKALTFSFLALTLVADLMYIFFVKLFVSAEVNAKVGGTRDTIVRVYGLVLTGMAFIIEIDLQRWVKYFPGLKGFIPRSFLLFFIATITSAHPLHENHRGKGNNDDDGSNFDYQVSSEIPSSTVVFQMVTSLILAGCALVYFVLGVLCFDRFTSRAFLSTRNPLVSTAIPHTAVGQVSPQSNPHRPGVAEI